MLHPGRAADGGIEIPTSHSCAGTTSVVSWQERARRLTFWLVKEILSTSWPGIELVSDEEIEQASFGARAQLTLFRSVLEPGKATLSSGNWKGWNWNCHRARYSQSDSHQILPLEPLNNVPKEEEVREEGAEEQGVVDSQDAGEEEVEEGGVQPFSTARSGQHLMRSFFWNKF